MGLSLSHKQEPDERSWHEDLHNGGVVQSSLPEQEWRGLRRFCIEHQISKVTLLRFFHEFVPSSTFVGTARVLLSNVKAALPNIKQQREITDLFIPLVIHQDNPYLPSVSAIGDSVLLSRLVVQAFTISAESTHDLLHDFFSGVFGKRHVSLTNSIFLYNFGVLLQGLCEPVLEYHTVQYILDHLASEFSLKEPMDIVRMARMLVRYPALCYSLLEWRKLFRRRMFGERMFEMRDPLPSQSFRLFGFTEQDRRCLVIRNPNRDADKLYFAGSRLPPEEMGVRWQRATNKRKSFLRHSADFLRLTSSAIYPQEVLSEGLGIHEWGFQTPQQAVRYTARVLLHDLLHNDRRGNSAQLPSPLLFLDEPVQLLSTLTDEECFTLKRRLGYKLLRRLIADAGVAVSVAQAALRPQEPTWENVTCNERKIPPMEQELQQQPSAECTNPSEYMSDVSVADQWITDQRLQQQFLFNPVTGERRWVVRVFNSHWEPVTTTLE